MKCKFCNGDVTIKDSSYCYLCHYKRVDAYFKKNNSHLNKVLQIGCKVVFQSKRVNL